MRIVYMLDGDDKISKDDWVRSLTFDGDANGYSCYSGLPTNNTRWLKVSDIFGPHVIGKTVDELHKGLEKLYHSENNARHYEFLRGLLPDGHLWNKPLTNPD